MEREDSQEQQDGLAELHFSIASALQRALKGLADEGDVRLLCYACGVDAAEIGLPPEHIQETESFLNEVYDKPNF
jgi:hypothetical protein